MNSFNHYSFGAIGNWLLTHCLGISWNDTALTIAPEPDLHGRLAFASGSVMTPFGKAASRWKIEGEDVIYEIDIPVETNFVDHTGTSSILLPGHHSIRR